MICHFSTRWYEGGKMDRHYTESGYVAGKDYNDCFSKIRDWYYADEAFSDMETIEISAVPCEDDECDILVTESTCPEKLTITYDPEEPFDEFVEEIE